MEEAVKRTDPEPTLRKLLEEQREALMAAVASAVVSVDRTVATSRPRQEAVEPAADALKARAAQELNQTVRGAVEDAKPELIDALCLAVVKEMQAQKNRLQRPGETAQPQAGMQLGGADAQKEGEASLDRTFPYVDMRRSADALCVMMAGLAAGLLLAHSL